MLFEIRLNELTKSLCFTVAAKSNDSASKKVDRIIFELEQNHGKVFTGFSKAQKAEQIEDFIYSVCRAGTHQDSQLIGDEITAHKITVGKNGHNGNYKTINNNVKVNDVIFELWSDENATIESVSKAVYMSIDEVTKIIENMQ